MTFGTNNENVSIFSLLPGVVSYINSQSSCPSVCVRDLVTEVGAANAVNHFRLDIKLSQSSPLQSYNLQYLPYIINIDKHTFSKWNSFLLLLNFQGHQAYKVTHALSIHWSDMNSCATPTYSVCHINL